MATVAGFHFTDFPGSFETVHFRHDQIRNNYIRQKCLSFFQSLSSVISFSDAMDPASDDGEISMSHGTITGQTWTEALFTDGSFDNRIVDPGIYSSRLADQNNDPRPNTTGAPPKHN